MNTVSLACHLLMMPHMQATEQVGGKRFETERKLRVLHVLALALANSVST